MKAVKHVVYRKSKYEGYIVKSLKTGSTPLNSIFLKFLLALVLMMSPMLYMQCIAQEATINQTEDKLKNTYGLDKLKVLNELTAYYQGKKHRKALKYGKQAVILGENIFTGFDATIDQNERHHLLQAYFQLGEVFYERSNYFQARDNLLAAESLSIDIGNDTYLKKTEDYLLHIQDMLDKGEIKENFLTKTLKDINVGKTVSGASKDLKIQAEIKLAENKGRKKDFSAAINHYENAINLLRDQGDAEQINELQLNIAFLLDSLGQHLEAQEFLTEAIKEMEGGLTDNKTFDMASVPFSDLPKLDIKQLTIDQESLRIEHKKLKRLSDQYAKQKDFEKSLAYYKMYQNLSQKMVEDSLLASTEKIRRESELLMLRQQKKIADLNVDVLEKEKQRQVRLRNTSVLIAFLILLGTLVTLYFYMTKRREHKKLTIAYRDLDRTKNKLEGAERKIVKLLRQQVSGAVASELLTNTTDKPGGRHFVCIMFLDIRDFTPMAEKLSPEEIIVYQNNVFGFMIDAVQKYGGNINQLLGDGFMATFGAPVSHGNDCQNAFLAAKEILKEVIERSNAGIIPKTKIGIGLHAGYVVTGNVGNEARKQYSVTGNPVIIASRVEQLNKTYKSQLIITEEVFKKLDQALQIKQPFLEVEIKGRSTPVKILKIA